MADRTGRLAPEAPRVGARWRDWLGGHGLAAPSRGPGLGRAPLTAVGMAAGALLVAIAYAGSRADAGWANGLFWAGEAVLYSVPAALLILSRRVSRREAEAVAVLLPLTSYVIEQSYGPGQLLFLDEFEHVRTAQAILSTHHLFHPNISLSVSPQYPGLEIVTTALVSISHLSLDVAAIIVVGVLHCLLAVGIYLVVLEITRGHRWAALAALIYATEPHFQFFDSYFIYQVMALPFLAACLLAAVKTVRAKTTASLLAWGGVALVSAAVTVISHHVTSYALLVLLACLEAGWLIRHRRGNWRLLTLLGLVAALAGGWDLGLATTTVAYFTPIVQGFFAGLGHHGGAPVTPGPSGPLFETGLEYVSVLLLGVLVPWGLWQLWRAPQTRRNTLALGLAVGSLGLYLALAAREVLAGGAQLWGRAATFIMIPAGFVVAWAILAPRSRPQRLGRWDRVPARLGQFGRPAAVVVVLLLALGGIAGGWPPYYARLPGAYEVGAWERSVDAHELDLAQWAAAHLPRDNGVAAGFITSGVLGTLGHQAGVGSVPSLFDAGAFTAAASQVVAVHRITLIVVNLRDARQVPADGYYFATAPLGPHNRGPLPARYLNKFAKIAGLSRIFDDGTMIVYDVTGSLYTARGGAA